MSQVGILREGSTLPGIETLTGDSGGSVPGAGSPVNINIVGGTGITTTGDPGTSTITIDADGTGTVNYTAVSSSPYVVTATDYFLGVDTSAARTIQLPNAPATGRTYVIKDRTGTAAAFNISVTTVGGVVLIDAAATYTINTNYFSVQVLFDGTKYEVF